MPNIECGPITVTMSPAPSSTPEHTRHRCRFLLTLVDPTKAKDDPAYVLALHGWNEAPDPNDPQAPPKPWLERAPSGDEKVAWARARAQAHPTPAVDSLAEDERKAATEKYNLETQAAYDAWVATYAQPKPGEYEAWLAQCQPVGGVEFDFPQKRDAFADPMKPTEAELRLEVKRVIDHWVEQMKITPGEPLYVQPPAPRTLAAHTVG